MKASMLSLSQKLIANGNFPGRYMLAEWLAKKCMPKNQSIEGFVGSYRMHFDLNDQVQRHIYFGLYDLDEICLLKKQLKKGDVFLDIGANIGYYSLVAAQIVGESGKVYAFEPIGSNAAILTRTIQENGITNIIVNQTAVGATSDRVTLYVGGSENCNSGWASIVPSSRRPQPIVVEMISLDEYLQSEAIGEVNLIKLDVEGAELNVFSGMTTLLARPNAPDLICEINPYLLERQGGDSRLITLYLDKFGYQLYRVNALPSSAIDPDQVLTDLTNLFCTKKPGQIEEG